MEQSGLDNAAVFSHAGWLRSILNTVTETNLTGKNIRCGNCALGIFEYSGGIWALHSWINL